MTRFVNHPTVHPVWQPCTEFRLIDMYSLYAVWGLIKFPLRIWSFPQKRCIYVLASIVMLFFFVCLFVCFFNLGIELFLIWVFCNFYKLVRFRYTTGYVLIWRQQWANRKHCAVLISTAWSRAPGSVYTRAGNVIKRQWLCRDHSALSFTKLSWFFLKAPLLVIVCWCFWLITWYN